MSLIAIWVDQSQANLYQFTANGIVKDSLAVRSPAHHTHAVDHIEEQKHEAHLFSELLPKLVGAEQILLLGPGIAKTHLKKFIEANSAVLGKKIVGCETTDHPTEPQLLSFASKFFNTEHLK